MKVFDAMLEMRQSAITEGRTPRRWEINHAAEADLMMDERIYFRDLRAPLIDYLMLGIPIALIQDRSDDPKAALIVDERP